MTTATDRGLNRKVGDDRGYLAGAATPAKDEVRHRAVRTCVQHAVDAAECAELLEMLGLSAGEGR